MHSFSIQIFYDRLYRGGSSQDGKTMMQLRNLINRRNIGHDVSGRFNASVDFFELVTRCHILVAALSFFGMADLDSEPSCNSLPDGISKWQKTRQWDFFSSLIGWMVD